MMRIRELSTKLSALALLTAVLAGGVGGCKRPNGADEGGLPRSETLYVAGRQWGEPTTFNPIQSSVQWPVNTINLMYETLLLYNPLTGKMEPLLAESFEQHEDNVEVTLNPNVRWSDGKPLTGWDVKYSFDLGDKNRGLPMGPVWQYISAVRLLDAAGNVVADTPTDTPDYPRRLQRFDNLRIHPRQPEQQISLQRQRGVFHRQIEQRQIMQLDHTPLSIKTAPLPVVIGDTEVEIAPTQEKRAIELARFIQQRLWRIQVATERRRALAEDAGLFERYGFTGITQIIRVIDTDAGDQCHIGIDHVDRVQTPAQPDFQHHRIETGVLKQPERRQGAHFEVCQRSVATACLDRCKGFTQLGISGFDAIDLHPLVVTQQVRRIVDTDAQALRPQQRSHECAGRTFAVGAGDRDYPRRRLA